LCNVSMYIIASSIDFGTHFFHLSLHLYIVGRYVCIVVLDSIDTHLIDVIIFRLAPGAKGINLLCLSDGTDRKKKKESAPSNTALNPSWLP